MGSLYFLLSKEGEKRMKRRSGIQTIVKICIIITIIVAFVIFSAYLSHKSNTSKEKVENAIELLQNYGKDGNTDIEAALKEYANEYPEISGLIEDVKVKAEEITGKYGGSSDNAVDFFMDKINSIAGALRQALNDPESLFSFSAE